MTVGDWVRVSASRLEEAGIPSARLEAQVLAGHAMGLDRAALLARPEREFPEELGESLLARRLTREPLPYITGAREFYGRTFVVTPDVLIPRAETETLVEAALEVGSGVVLDLGTGSGCVAISIKLANPALRVVASDLSFNALRVAAENRRRLGAEVALVNGDGLGPFSASSFDLIVTNPPYVGTGDELPPEIAEWEPAAALYAGEEGLAFYRRLSEQAGRVLRPGGALLMELGDKQFEAVRALFESAGWAFLGAWRDLMGVQRVLGLRAG